MEEDRSATRNLVMVGALALGALYYLNRRYRRVDPANEISDLTAETQSGSARQQLMRRGQHMLEETLDNLSEQAMGEVKAILKSGLRRLDQAIDDL